MKKITLKIHGCYRILQRLCLALIIFGTFISTTNELCAQQTPNDSKSKSPAKQIIELQFVEFLENYPYEWKGIADGVRLYWTFIDGGAGLFLGVESVGIIPKEPVLLDTSRREINNRLLYQQDIESAVPPIAIELPTVASVNLSLSSITLAQLLNDARTFDSQSLTRSYLGFIFFPLEFELSDSFDFVLGLEFLLGYQHGHLNFNNIRADFAGAFGAIEPNFRIRYKLTDNAALSFILPSRFLWSEPVRFQNPLSRGRVYGSDWQRGIALAFSVEY